MSRAYDHHRPCPCGAELADECPSCARTNPLGSMQLRAPGDRTGWFGNNHDAEHLAQLAHEREHGPAAGEEAQ